MTDITVGILGGLGSGLTWASSSILVRSLSGSYGVAGVNALRSLVGGGLLLAVAFATGHGAEIMRAPLWAVLSLGTSIVIALAIGLGGSIAARTMDALYGEVPHLMRGRVISRNELVFQLANVTGAAFAVLVYPGPRVGFAAVAGGLVAGGVMYASEVRLALRHEAGRWLLGPHVRPDALPLALLSEAIRLNAQGDHDVSIVVADSAVRALAARATSVPGPGSEALWEAVRAVVEDVVSGTLTPGPEESQAVIDAAAALIGEQA